MKRGTVIFLLLWLAAAPLWAGELPCVIEPSAEVDLGSPVIGVLDRLDVQRGDRVRKGQVIGELRAEVERKAIDLATLRANDQAEVQAALAAREHAKREKKRAILLFQKKLVSKQYLDKAVTEASIAEHKLEQARHNLAQARKELALAQARLAQRILRSPIDGIVTERYLSPGQRVQDQPVVRIVATDPLDVEIIVPAEHFNRLRRGQTVRVTPQLAGLDGATGRIDFIDSIIDPASNTFRVTVKLPNPDGRIPAGARCQADLGLDDEPPPPTP